MSNKIMCEVCKRSSIHVEQMDEKESKVYRGSKIWVCPRCIEKGSYCLGCLENGLVKNRSGDNLQGNPLCKDCAPTQQELLILNFIRSRIADLGSEDKSRGHFVIRELVQNADDENANILVLRFQEDALYVANDGVAFSTEDWYHIHEILGGHKENQQDKTGHFGSGFQTVYTFTNFPEVHSNGISRWMNPINGKTKNVSDKSAILISPYVRNKNKGAIFRFPWRDNRAALEAFEGRTHFKDTMDWPRWESKEKRDLFDELVKYSHVAFLCCQNLRVVRLIYSIGGITKSYQVKKDFSLSDTDYQGEIGTVVAGFGTTSDEFSSSFLLEDFEWDGEEVSYPYLIGSRRVIDEDGLEMHIVKEEREKGTEHYIQHDVRRGQTEIKKNLVHVLLPLFDCTSLLPEEEAGYVVSPYPLYSVIPLPAKSLNRFVFTGHFFPTQGRKDVNIYDIYGEWYRLCMANVFELYKEVFDDLLVHVTSKEHPSTESQIILLNAIPTCIVNEWMRPGKADDEADETWWECYEEDIEELLFENNVILDKEQETWSRIEDNYYCKTDEQYEILDILRVMHLEKDVIKHPSFKTFNKERIETNTFDDEAFAREWSNAVNCNEIGSGDGLLYGDRTEYGLELDKNNIGRLIRYCFRAGHPVENFNIAIVPGSDRVFRPILEYPLISKEYVSLLPLLPESKRVHPDFVPSTIGIASGTRTLRMRDVLNLLSEIVEQEPNRFDPMDDDTFQYVSDIVSKAVLSKEFGLSIEHKDLLFVPYSLDGKQYIGTPNSTENGLLIGLEAAKVGENQERDSIFARNSGRVDGLTKEVESNIHFLSLNVNEKDLNTIENKLNLVKLQERVDTPTNFVRHFLSPKHGSLFDDRILSEFIGVSDKKKVNAQKIEFQKALKVYFKEGDKGKSEQDLKRNDMASVPCLYDAKGTWHPAGEFAYEMYPELDFGFLALHPDLKSWGPDCLLALGVKKSPDARTIVSEIDALVKKRSPDQNRLANIFAYVLTTDVEDADALEDLREKAWVPLDGNFVKPLEVVLPNEKNLETVGNVGGIIFDIGSCAPELRDRLRCVIQKRSVKNLDRLGCKLELGLTDLLKIVDHLRASGTPPDDGLFDILSQKCHGKRPYDRGKGHGYYLGDEWIDSDHILLTRVISIPGIEEMDIKILPPDHPHHNYLEWDGAENEPRPDVILRMIVDGRLESSKEIWDILDRYPMDLDHQFKWTISETSVYPFNGTMIAPRSVVLYPEGRPDLRSGPVGSIFLLGEDCGKIHRNALNSLGARSVYQLREEDIVRILAGIETSRELPLEEANNILRFVQYLKDLGKMGIKFNGLSWPCMVGDSILMTDVKKAYIPGDDLEVRDAMKSQSIPIPILDLDGKRHHDLERIVISNGARSVRGITDLKFKGGKTDSRMFNPILTKAVQNLDSSSPEIARSAERGAFTDWLRELKIYEVESLSLRYDLGGGREISINKERCSITDGEKGLEMLVVTDEPLKMASAISSALRKRMALVNERLSNDALDFFEQFAHKIVLKSLSEPDPEEVEFSSCVGGNGENQRMYLSLRSELNAMYGCCQICERRTPYDDTNNETQEVVKSLVGMRSAMFHSDEPTKYSLGNVLLMCPTHSALLGRGLVRFNGISAKSDAHRMVEELEEGIQRFKAMPKDDSVDTVNYQCEVFEGELRNSSWEIVNLKITKKHLISILENLRDYFQRRMDDEEQC